MIKLLILPVLAVIFAMGAITSSTDAANRAEIEGRDLLLDGQPHIPHGMIHVGRDQLPNLQRMGIDSLSIDLAFSAYDPQRSDAENDKALAETIAMADAAHKHGMTILWLFSFHYTPDWLWERYPDVRMKQHDGADGSGGWMQMCLDHPGFRADAEKWLRFTVSRLRKHPATIGYILWNEPHLTGTIDYNPHTIAAFRTWLKKGYGNIGKLNETWQTSLPSFDAVEAPPPRASTHWHQIYDKMVSEGAGASANTTVDTGNPAIWMDWMRFRQENFTAFWKWETDIVRKAHPDAIITSKIVALDLYTSHAYGVGTNTEQWTNTFLDVVGMDLYPHLDENFLARWKCDYFLSLSAGKPIWHTEFNFSFIKERGLATPEQWRTTFYYQLARGVNGYWNFMWSDDVEYTLHYKGYKPAPVTHEIAALSKQMRTLAPILRGMKPQAAQVAVLHSATTGLALSGDYAPTADQSTIIDLLYRSQTPYEFVTEQMIRDGVLQKYRALIAVGAVALSDDVLDAIHRFTTDNGGHVLANARFGELDEFARPRPQHPPQWMGARATDFHRQPREKTGTLELRRQARDVENKPLDIQVKLDTWSSRPITLAGGAVTGSGHLFGNEDSQMEWSSQGRHELYWEDVETLGEGTVVGTFDDGKPAIVITPQTAYVARDTCWVDEQFEQCFNRFLSRSGVLNKNTIAMRDTGAPAPHVDLRMWQSDGQRLLFVINSAPTLHYDGTPVQVNVTFDACGEVTDALTGSAVPSRWKDFKRVIPLTLKAGEVRVLVGAPYPSGWQGVKKHYDEMAEYFRPSTKPYATWRRSSDQLWVYDNRPELGMGAHGLSQEHIDLIKDLGVRIVRYTIYWNAIETTAQAGVYDEEALKGLDESIERAKQSGIDLLLIVHGDPHGGGWDNRHETYERFANFMEFIVKRYPHIKYWELWNEMDTAFTNLFGARRENYPMFERGRCYAQMLKVTSPRIRQANPDAWIVCGGLSNGSYDDFIRGIYEEGGRDHFDFMNIHTYGVPVNWGMATHALLTRQTMGRYGDFNRPMWNTEFGIDAGNMWVAHKRSTGEQFDEGHLSEWKTCITEAMKHRLYAKILPYQFHAQNEAASDQLNDPANNIQFGEGRTPDDYGIGLLRADAKTPRPTYHWLKKAQVNRAIHNQPTFRTDVELEWDGTWRPAGIEHSTTDGKIILKNVAIDSLKPTVIQLEAVAPASSGS